MWPQGKRGQVLRRVRQTKALSYRGASVRVKGHNVVLKTAYSLTHQPSSTILPKPIFAKLLKPKYMKAKWKAL
jgi:hypothetical protein